MESFAFINNVSSLCGGGEENKDYKMGLIELAFAHEPQLKAELLMKLSAQT